MEGGIPWMVVPSDGVGVLGRQLSDKLSAALSRLYVRLLRPDKNAALYDTVRVQESRSGIVAWTPTRVRAALSARRSSEDRD